MTRRTPGSAGTLATLAVVLVAACASGSAARAAGGADPCAYDAPRTVFPISESLRLSGPAPEMTLTRLVHVPASALRKPLVVRFAFQLAGIRAPAGSFADVSLLVNGRSAALVELERTSIGVRWTTAGVIQGRRSGVIQPGSRSLELRMVNVPQVRSVTAGDNTVTVKLERHNGFRADALYVNGSSGLAVVNGSLPHLRLVLPDGDRDRQMKVGGSVRVPYIVRNLGNCPARDVAVGVLLPESGSVTVQGANEHRIGNLRGSIRGEFVLRGVSRAKDRAFIGVNSSANHPGSYLFVPVNAGGRSRKGLLIMLGLVAGLMSLAALLVASRSGRSERTAAEANQRA